MTRRLLAIDPPVEITLRRSRAARRFSLRVSQIDRAVTLSMPARARESDAIAFAAGQADWLRRVLGRAAPAVAVGFGTCLPVEGRARQVIPGAVRAAELRDAELVLPPDPARAGLRAGAFLKLLARDRLAAAVARHAAAVGRPVMALRLRDTRARWGSCSSGGALMFSWRLVMAPPEILDYVAAHEVAHLVEMNHSPAFWAVVARLCPAYARHRAWLRTKGQALHAWRFGG
jgi:hypothetical protein